MKIKVNTFKDTEGKTYQILHQEGNYALIAELATLNPDPFVVTYLLDINDHQIGSWKKGQHFSTLENGTKHFQNQIKA